MSADPLPELLKLVCCKCGTAIYLETQTVEARGLDLHPFGEDGKSWPDESVHLGCPFCKRTRGGYYPMGLSSGGAA